MMILIIAHLHRIGPLPFEPKNSVVSQISPGAAIPSFTTYASGYYPVVDDRTQIYTIIYI